ncbi:hypothetical protein RU97_GL002495 [Enterococcus canis]|uniref:LysM domain-containing protein n=1 Tax=Enterococcus canis TaxID=214095 RepID=A0A1L8RDA1_9ENTE|nr:LysM domain-containing protein [Enterococcus canis]OJG17705.1 hypothetical protein RU97_GL002495 [Enterococcus canis]
MKKFIFTLAVGAGFLLGGNAAFAAEQTHVVQPGDSLSSLSIEYGTTIDSLLGWNPQITNPDLIFDGDTLVVASDEAPVKETTEEVATAAPAEEASQPAQPAAEETTEVAATEAVSQPTSGSGVLNPVDGVNYYNGVYETYYSQQVLPGGGLNIPGRHVAADGTIRDADGYIVVASDNQAKGSTGESSLGAYKVYDNGVGHNGIDVYTNW